MSGSGGGGESKSSNQSESKVLTAEERSALYNGALRDISSTNLGVAGYKAPEYTGSGTAKTLTNGDYEQLQSALQSGYTSGLDYAKGKDLAATESNSAKRGIWSSGLAEQAVNDVNSSYAPQYAKAGADATNTRYNLQNNENQAVNSYNQTEANKANTFNLTNAESQYTSNWQPLEYLKSLWSGTGGSNSSSSGNSSSWNANMGGGIKVA